MMMSRPIATLTWPSTVSQALTIAHLSLLWVVGTYFTFRNRPDSITEPGEKKTAGALVIRDIAVARGTIMLVGVMAIVQSSAGAVVLLLGMVLATLTAALTWLRGQSSPTARGISVQSALSDFGAELELLTTLIAVAVIAYAATSFDLTTHDFIHIAAPEHRIAIALASAAIIGFASRGGVHIVRGVLEKGQAVPSTLAAGDSPNGTSVTHKSAVGKAAKTVDVPVGNGNAAPISTTEYRRGRVIGAVERILMVVLVASGSYEALAFITAAKGLIRSKDLEVRSFAEYFLIGTMSSATLALILGFVLRAVIKRW